MSYARWSHSKWYAFDNCNGLFSLWFAGEDEFRDWPYDVLKDMQTTATLDEWLKVAYPDADEDDLEEAIRIIGMALEDRRTRRIQPKPSKSA